MSGSYLFMYRGKQAKVYGPIEDDLVKKARKTFYFAGFSTYIIPKPPHERTLRKWRAKGKMKAIDGCEVNGLCSCSHNKLSWANVFMQVKESQKKYLDLKKKVV